MQQQNLDPYLILDSADFGYLRNQPLKIYMFLNFAHQRHNSRPVMMISDVCSAPG